MNAPEATGVNAIVLGTRARAGLFRTDQRGLLEVYGEDRVRWLDGMISGDVERLEMQGPGAGCYAMFLTNRGKILADLHVGHMDDHFVLECRRDAIARVAQSLERFIIADDVRLEDRTGSLECIGLEGPSSVEILQAATGLPAETIARLGREQWTETEIAGEPVRIGAFGWSGETAFQIFARRGRCDAVFAALKECGRPFELVLGDVAALETLRVEAGIPALDNELDENVLPPEARLEHAISIDKGCYVGQEIVARLRSRGQVNHLLVGLEFPADALPTPGSAGEVELTVGGRRTGELTSFANSPVRGPIGLGFVRREHSEPGTVVEFLEGTARVAELPFVDLRGFDPAVDSDASPAEAS